MAVAAPSHNTPLVSPSPDVPGHFAAADLEQFTDEGLHYELVEGTLREMAPPGGEHGGTTMSLSAYLTVYILNNQLGQCFTAETGFLLARNPDTVLAPDFAYVSQSRFSGSLPRGYVPVVPDLVLETRSPHDTKRAAEEKVAQWLSFGVSVCLEMNPREYLIRVYRPQSAGTVGPLPDTILGTQDTLVLPDILPGFSLSLRQVFRD